MSFDDAGPGCDRELPRQARDAALTFSKLIAQRDVAFDSLVHDTIVKAGRVPAPPETSALGSRRFSWAEYLNHVHNKVHPVFADQFLVGFGQLPKDDALNADLNVVVLLELDAACGNIVALPIVESSNVPAFDAAAIIALKAAAPFGAPPAEVVSADGRVHFLWRLYRNPQYACSTYTMSPRYWPTAR